MIISNFKSPFLEKPRVLENDIGLVVYDAFPVAEGHCLVVPKRVYSNYFDSTPEEVKGLHDLVFQTKQLLDDKFNPDSYNVGINCGEHAGQTVPHVHIHLIPRYKGDMENPRSRSARIPFWASRTELILWGFNLHPTDQSCDSP